MNLNDCDIGYLAGFIDGEGALLINKREHVGYKGKRYITFSAYVDIGNTNREVLEWIRSKTLTTSNIYENQMAGNRKLAYRLRISYKTARILIPIIQSLLIIKAKQAEIFNKYGEAKTFDERDALFKIMKKLNQRGIIEV